MARPNKKGLEFYRCNTNRYQDPKIKRLIFKHKSDGIAVWDFLLNEIYRVEGSYITYDENLVFTIADALKITEKNVSNIIHYCVEIKLFDRKIMEEYSILTSKPIQVFYKEAAMVSRRKVCNIPESIQLMQEETQLMQKKTEETAEKVEEMPQQNITEHNITEQLFIYSENENSENEKLQPFFTVGSQKIVGLFSEYIQREYQIVFEGELMRRELSSRKAEILKKLDDKYTYSSFENSRHIINALKSLLDNMDNKFVKVPVSVRGTKKVTSLVNWGGNAAG